MSDALYTVFPPLDYGAMSCNDLDKAFVMDCTANMTARNDTITSIGTALVQRTDGYPTTSQDVSVLSTVVLTGGLKFGWTLKGNGNSAIYIVSFPITLASGSTIYRSIKIRALPAIG